MLRHCPDFPFRTFLAAGLFDEALSACESFEGAFDRAHKIAELVEQLGSTRPQGEVIALLLKARQLASAVEDGEDKDSVLSAIATAYAAADLEEGWRGAVDAIQMMEYRMAPLAAFATRTLAAGHAAKASELFAELMGTASAAMEGPDAKSRVCFFDEPIRVCLRVGRIPEAIDLLHSVPQDALKDLHDSVPEGLRWEMGRPEICAALIQKRDFEGARGLIEEMHSAWHQVRALTQMAAAYLETGETSEAARVLRTALRRAIEAGGPSPDEAAAWAVELATLLSRNGFEKEARELAQRVEEAGSLAVSSREQALLHLARESIGAGNLGLTRRALASACRVARANRNCSALIEIAAQYRRLGEPDAEMSTLDSAVAAVSAYAPRVQTLWMIAAGYRAAGQEFSLPVQRLLEGLVAAE